MSGAAYFELSDEQLIGLTLNGDRNAFGEIVNRYQDMVARTVRGMLGDAVYAEDIGQDTFIRLYKALPGFRGEAKLSTYLTRIAVNLTLNEIKKRKRTGNLVVTDNEKDKVAFNIADNIDHSQRDINEVVNKALEMLEAKYRIVVVMRLLQGYSTKETAEILRIPSGTVLSRLSRAQDKLKEILKRLQ